MFMSSKEKLYIHCWLWFVTYGSVSCQINYFSLGHTGLSTCSKSTDNIRTLWVQLLFPSLHGTHSKILVLVRTFPLLDVRRIPLEIFICCLPPVIRNLTFTHDVMSCNVSFSAFSAAKVPDVRAYFLQVFSKCLFSS